MWKRLGDFIKKLAEQFILHFDQAKNKKVNKHIYRHSTLISKFDDLSKRHDPHTSQNMKKTRRTNVTSVIEVTEHRDV